VDAITLLAESATPSLHLQTEDGRFRLGVRVYDDYQDTYVHVRAYLRDLGERPHFHLLLDRDAGVYATALAGNDEDASKRIRERMGEAAIKPDGDERDMAAGGPGVSQLEDEDGPWGLSVRARAHIPLDDEESLLRVRLFARDFGHTELVLASCGRIVSLTSGKTDKEAYSRTRGELSRRGIELED